jgi:hypothetical protein
MLWDPNNHFYISTKLKNQFRMDECRVRPYLLQICISNGCRLFCYRAGAGSIKILKQLVCPTREFLVLSGSGFRYRPNSLSPGSAAHFARRFLRPTLGKVQKKIDAERVEPRRSPFRHALNLSGRAPKAQRRTTQDGAKRNPGS